MMMNDSINNVVCDTLNVAAQNLHPVPQPSNWWMWFAIVELLIILVLIMIISGKKTKQKDDDLERFKSEAKNGEVDFGDLINSAFNSKGLYKELRIKCHPDIFSADPEKNKIADQLSKEIGKNKHNFKRLKELKLEAKEKLNIDL